MRVVGLGIDVVEVGRVADAAGAFGGRFAARVLHPGELLDPSSPGLGLAIAFAIKEAVLKALGTGWGAGAALSDVEVRRDAAGLAVRLHGGAARQLARLGGNDVVATVCTAGGTVLAAALAVSIDLTPGREARSNRGPGDV